MGTFEISTDGRFASSLRYLQHRLDGKVVDVGKGNARAVLVISNTTDKEITDALTDIIITDCKSYYINSNIKLPIEDEISRHAFIRALSTFDRDTDKIIAKTILDNFYSRSDSRVKAGLYSCNLDGIYEFMLNDLKSRWNEVCLLANENICYLMCQNTFLELLRFLISNIESLSEEAHIVDRDGELVVLGRGLKPLQEIYINESLPRDVKVVTKLVSIAPKKIFLHLPAMGGSDNLIQNIQNLFGTCVVVN